MNATLDYQVITLFFPIQTWNKFYLLEILTLNTSVIVYYILEDISFDVLGDMSAQRKHNSKI